MGPTDEVTPRRYQIADSRAYALDVIGAMTDSVPDAMFMKGRDGRYLFCNAAGAVFLGKPLKEIVGATDLELFEIGRAHV